MLRVHVDEAADAELSSTLDETVAEGASGCWLPPSKPRSTAYVSSLTHEVDEHGPSPGGAQRTRRAPIAGHRGRADRGPGPAGRRPPGRRGDRRERMRFRSSILPPWARKSPKVAEVLPLMYLHGMSSGDFVPALEEFFGSAAGLSASVITRLTTDWQQERDQFAHRSLKDVDYVYLLRRRHPLQRPPRRGPAVCPGHRRCAQRRHQGAGLDQRRTSRVHRVLGRRAARRSSAAA